MSTTILQVLPDLAHEGDWLDGLLAPLPDEDWRRPTPADGWDIATTVAHLAWTDECATLAARSESPEGKAAWDELVLAAIEDPDGFVDAEALRIGRAAREELLARWRTSRQELARILTDLPADTRMPWFGPPMSPTSMATARYMETWAHSLDIADALGVSVEPHDRVRHVVHIGVRTRDFSHVNAGEQPPADEFRVELTAPSGETWTYGPEDASQRVTGSAWDFALLVTQRAHRDDLDVHAHGEQADHWLDIAQAFAGPSGSGRVPRGDA